MKVKIKKPCIKGAIIVADGDGYKTQPYDIPYLGEKRFTEAQARKAVKEWAVELYGDKFRFIESLETCTQLAQIELDYKTMKFTESEVK